MKFIDQEHEILYLDSDLLKRIERAGRTCYQSQDKITDESAVEFVSMLQRREHSAMLEVADITVKFITNRGVTHEIVRHRPCSFAQESTRYVKYGSDHMEFIQPVWLEDITGSYGTDEMLDVLLGSLKENEDTAKNLFITSCFASSNAYEGLMKNGWRPEQAREVLPNALKTEIAVKANVRQWLHMFKLRTSKAAHPQIRALMIELLEDLGTKFPSVFGRFQ